ncbi:hypothetical protein IMG5_101740 [Ichthyophthirius multifiliis]|uniref:Uncharacterized protein n=1 Tax=Ichthyophthirius multifiliis TaxID=5932 RepID=G0QSK3_ICHMU|nr:hypothetical protein IMG5_101740 [Ichthyophthirius multifiliis]EGR31802.1 hypothetical protein IMG5_101740 [Ichthyophthirius multifiliis]|eukprot:XP_004035288.1 hypothetical protein IMG5_101740 [Ichthyophthirius multifiliis]
MQTAVTVPLPTAPPAQVNVQKVFTRVPYNPRQPPKRIIQQPNKPSLQPPIG